MVVCRFLISVIEKTFGQCTYMHVHLYLLFYFILAFRVLYTIIMTNKLYYIHFAMTIT